MAQVELIRTFYAYNAWANERILTTAVNLTLEQFTAKAGASFDSVRDTLVHTMNVQKNWIARCQQRALDPAMTFTDFAELSAVHRVWTGVETVTRTYITSVDEAALNQVIEYVNSRGQPCAYPRWQMLLHQVNHATQHRSEVAVMLTQFGHSPGDLDLTVYLDSTKS